MRTILIDDEAPARAALRGLLGDHPEIEIVGEADNISEATERLNNHDYELVFLDVHLRGGTGFDLVPFVRPEAKIIFVTGSEQHAIRAFEINALDYVTKPVRPERLATAVHRLLSPATASNPPVATAPELSSNDHVYVRTGTGKSRFVALLDIGAVVSNQNYSDILLTDGTKIMVRRTMKRWEESLPAEKFVRVHRSNIVNIAHYRGADQQSYETTLLHLEGIEEPVRASYRYLPELRAKLEAMGLKL